MVREAIILADDRLQLFGGLAGDLVDLDAACTKDLGGLGIHFVGNENFWHDDVSLFSSSPPRKRGPSSCRLRWRDGREMGPRFRGDDVDRKSTRLNSSH